MISKTTRKTTRNMIIGLSVLTAICIVSTITPAYAAVPDSPLDQYQSGVPLKMIQCSDDKVLMETQSGKPVCLTIDSATVLSDRGYSVVIYLEEENIFEDNVKTTHTPTTIKANTLPITTTTKYPFMAELEQIKKAAYIQKRPASNSMVEDYALFTDLQGATGASEVTLPFSVNATRIGYLPDGMIVKYIWDGWSDQPEYNGEICDSFAYQILPSFVEVDLNKITSWFIQDNGGFSISVSTCMPKVLAEHDRLFDSMEEKYDYYRQAAGRNGGVEVREDNYLGVYYIMHGKSDGNGASAVWEQHGLVYGLQSENYSMDLMEKVVQGMIE